MDEGVNPSSSLPTTTSKDHTVKDESLVTGRLWTRFQNEVTVVALEVMGYTDDFSCYVGLKGPYQGPDPVKKRFCALAMSL